MYGHTPIYEWIEWSGQGDGEPDPAHDFTGFRARIQRNPIRRELRADDAAFAAWLADARNVELQDICFQRIAPRVVEWDFQIDGVPVPAPGEVDGNWEAFDLLESDLASWLLWQVRLSHLPKVTTPSSTIAGTTDAPNPSETPPEPEPLSSS